VDSAAVLLEPRKQALAVEDTEAFVRFVGQCFRHKRKTIRNNLAETYGNRIDSWPEAGLRAEQISLEHFAALHQRLL
jgi:16S rRNA A1518/A1519 N6-dimethyltransferase RsmA/KsgA/DIM1 with predicted DNA glycosylase/AP lyase activity